MRSCGVTQVLGTYTSGEKPAPLQYTFRDSDGVVIDLTGYTVRFVWRPKGGPDTTGNGTLANPTGGVVEYIWTGGEFLTTGRYEAQFWVGNLTNRWASDVIEWTVQAPTGAVPNI